jgi:hypothetical protein
LRGSKKADPATGERRCPVARERPNSSPAAARLLGSSAFVEENLDVEIAVWVDVTIRLPK